MCPQKIGELGFALKIGEEGRKVGFAGMGSFQRIQGRIDGIGPFGVNHLTCSFKKSQQPDTRQLLADQAEVDPNFAVAAGAASKVLATLDDLDGDAEAHLKKLPY